MLAVKMAPLSQGRELYSEWLAYQHLSRHGGQSGLPVVLAYLQEPAEEIIVMQRLGLSLGTLVSFCGFFDIDDVLSIGSRIVRTNFQCVWHVG